MMTRTLCAALLAAACVVSPAAAQQPSQRQVDSLAAALRAVRARLDSLLAALHRQQPRAGGEVRDAAPPADELAALRAAAARAAGGARDSAQVADTTPTRFVGRERNQSRLNPEISVTGNFHAQVRTEGPQQDNFELHEVEISFQAALDPYSHTKIFAGIHEDGVEIEEAYFYYAGLPARLRLDVGAFRQQLGELNRWHVHGVPETEYPAALRNFAGDEGLAAPGVSLYRAFSGLGTHEVWAQVTLGSNAVLFDGGNRPAYLVHVNNFWQLSRSTYAQIGVTGLYGTNDGGLKATLGGADFRLTWRPPARALYREWTLRSEIFALRKDRAGAGDTRLGGYIGSTFRLSQRWIAGVRGDYAETPEGPNPITRQIVPSLTWWQSEWVFLRGEFTHRLTPIPGLGRNQLVLQAVWAIGPHKHETY